MTAPYAIKLHTHNRSEIYLFLQVIASDRKYLIANKGLFIDYVISFFTEFKW